MIEGMKTDIATFGFERGMRGVEKPVRDAFQAPAKAERAGSESASERSESFQSSLENKLKSQAKSQPQTKAPSKAQTKPVSKAPLKGNAKPQSNDEDMEGQGENIAAYSAPQEKSRQTDSKAKNETSEATAIEASAETKSGKKAATAEAPSRVDTKQTSKIPALKTGEIAGIAASQAEKVEGESKVDPGLIEMLESFGKEQAAVKQMAVGQFMVKMQEEFGIPPEKILEAFANLDKQTLAAPPEQAMEKFLSQLDIEPEEMPRAESLYQSMVAQTGEAELGVKFAGLEKGVNFDVASPRDVSERKLQTSLDDMNEKFFGRIPEQGAVKAPVQGQVRTMTSDDLSAQIARLASEKSQRQVSPINVSTAALASAAAQADEGAFGEEALSGDFGDELDLSTLTKDSFGAASAGKGFSAQLEGMSANGSNFSFGGGMSQQNGQGSSNLSESAQKNLMGQLKNSDGPAKAKKFSAEMSAASATASTPTIDSTTSAVAPGLSASTLKAATAGTAAPAAMMLNGPQPTSQDEADNVKELIKQAQVMLKKGGGEMKLEMSPEGMGQVHLKVAVENGQVNVQMLTESDAAKKLIENGLSELKASLAAHKLHVEKMQIDVGQEISKHMDQKAGQDASREQARQMAQDFLGQFRQERESFRQMFTDGFGSRGYGRAQNRAQIDPEPVVRQSAAGRSNAGSDRRLNLVA